MWFFLDRLISTAIPRIRDFRGLPTRSFDGRGNYTLGVKEQIIFPEIDYDDVRKVHGMDVSIVTSTDKDDEGFALLRELGVTGTIRSPTYTLVEPYESPAGRVLHMDCYRLGDAEELDMLGLRDRPPESTLWLVEWPERAAGALPAIDLAIRLTLQGEGRSAEIDARQNGRLEQTLHSLHE